MIKDLIKLADVLDEKGLIKEADYLDGVIRKWASDVSTLGYNEDLSKNLSEEEIHEESSKLEKELFEMTTFIKHNNNKDYFDSQINKIKIKAKDSEASGWDLYYYAEPLLLNVTRKEGKRKGASEIIEKIILIAGGEESMKKYNNFIEQTNIFEG